MKNNNKRYENAKTNIFDPLTCNGNVHLNTRGKPLVS